MIDVNDLQPGDRITVAGTFVRMMGALEAGDNRRVVFDIAEVSYSVAPSAVVSVDTPWKQNDKAYSEVRGVGQVLKVGDETAIIHWHDGKLSPSYPLKLIRRSPWAAK